MPLDIIREDLTKLAVDAVVNPSNPELFMGSLDSVSGQLFRVAGIQEMTEACQFLKPIKYGQAVITSAFNLPSKYVIHVANPMWLGGKGNEEDYLRKTYQAALALAKHHKLETIAFPLLSSGTYGYPKEMALSVAVSEIQSFVLKEDMMVYLVVYDNESFSISKKLSASVKTYLKDHFVQREEVYKNTPENRRRIDRNEYRRQLTEEIYENKTLDEYIKERDESFASALFRIIDDKQENDVQVYKRSNVSKATFSKINSNISYQPKKTTAMAFCIGLKLNMTESLYLLSTAGYTLSKYAIQDNIFRYFIEHKIYDIMEVNTVMYDYDQSQLGN